MLMKGFFNTIAFGATLATGIVSVFQNVPLVEFIKRTSLTFIVFYFVGAALVALWNTAAVYMPTSSVNSSKESSEEKVES